MLFRSTTEPVVEKKEVAKQTKTIATKKKVAKVEKEDDVFPAIKRITTDQKLTSENKDISLTNEVTVVPAKENKVVVTKKKRKISTKLFSRAPLREDDDDDELPVPAKKKELKKLEIKD